MCAPGDEGVDGDRLPVGDLWWSDLVGFGRVAHCSRPFPFVDLDHFEVALVGVGVEDLAQRVDGLGGEWREVVGVHVLGRADRRMSGSLLDMFSRDFV